MDPLLIAAGGIACFGAGWLGAVFHNTLMAGKGEENPNACKPGDDAFTIARLTEEGNRWEQCYKGARTAANANANLYYGLADKLAVLEAENADLRIDIAAKAQRLADAGLQSSGGIDPTVSA